MRIGILGTGDVGRALARGFEMLGHEVKIGGREAKGGNTTFAEAAKFGELLVVATLWAGTKNALELAGPQSFAGKVVIDCTNPLDFSKGGPQLALGHTDSGGEQVQRWLPDAKVVKAFNIVGNAHMVKPDFPGGPPDMFYCGNDTGAKATVKDILVKLGWNTIDLGGIQESRLLEPLCILWVKYGVITGGWNHAFKMLRK